MMKIFSLAIITILFTVNLCGQNLLGYKPLKVEKYMRKNHSGLIKDNNTSNEYYDYLKYTDGTAGTSTVYFFFSEDNTCRLVKSMYVYSMKDEVEEELDRLYTRTGNSRWSDSRGRVNALIELKDEEWFFTVNIEPESKE